MMHWFRGTFLLLTTGLSIVYAQQEKPNVLFLMSDEHSGRVVRADSNKIVNTPNLDALADDGVLFKHTYCQNPVCVPSRASIATGKMPSKVGVFTNGDHKNDVLRDYPDSIARVFKNAGYTVEWLGKEHWGTTNAGLGFGNENKAAKDNVKTLAKAYDALYQSVGRLPEEAQILPWNISHIRDGVYTDHAISLLNDYDGSKPFFLGLSLFLPHFPFIVEKRHFDMYKNIINLPRVTNRMLQDLPLHNKKHRQKYNFGNLTNWRIKRARAVYYGMITYVDEQFGRVIKKLKQKGLFQNTIIVYVSDHGEHAGEHGLWYKNSFYEDSVKVPMIISYAKELPKGRKYWWPVQLMDVVPTLYELCGIQPPNGLDGNTLLPVIRGQENGRNRHAISETYAGRSGRMVRERKWKYCWFGDGKRQLFDMWNDPAEEFNLHNDTRYAVLVQNLHNKAMAGYIPK